LKYSGLKAGTGDPDPGAHAAEACAQARGACRRERGDEPDTDDRADLFVRSATAAQCSRAANERFVFSVCRMLRLKPTLVVKISDTSLTGKAGSNPACEVTHRGATLARDPHAPRLLFVPCGRTGVESLRPISPVPQRTHQGPVLAPVRRW